MQAVDESSILSGSTNTRKADMAHRTPIVRNEVIVSHNGDVWIADVKIVTSLDSYMPIHIEAPSQAAMLETVKLALGKINWK